MAVFFVTLCRYKVKHVIMSPIEFIIQNSDSIYNAITHLLLLFIAFKKK
jgi:DNA-directed RNA polymerase subunit L